MSWRESHRGDPRARVIADRHYNRQKPGTAQFVPPGSCLVYWQPKAFWVSSWPFAEYVKHAWPGAWICSAFRNEGAGLSSELIREAIALTRGKWTPPELGMVTFVDRDKTKPKSADRIGECFQRAGFTLLPERTKGGLYVLQMLPDEMPEPMEIESRQRDLFALTT